MKGEGLGNIPNLIFNYQALHFMLQLLSVNLHSAVFGIINTTHMSKPSLVTWISSSPSLIMVSCSSSTIASEFLSLKENGLGKGKKYTDVPTFVQLKKDVILRCSTLPLGVNFRPESAKSHKNRQILGPNLKLARYGSPDQCWKFSRRPPSRQKISQVQTNSWTRKMSTM